MIPWRIAESSSMTRIVFWLIASLAVYTFGARVSPPTARFERLARPVVVRLITVVACCG